MNTTFVYNWDNKLSSAASGSKSISLKYDPDGNRVQKYSSTQGTRKYITDTVGDLPVILLELDPMSNFAIRKTYIYGNSQILAQHDGSYTAPKYFYLHDRLGSVRQIINSSGQVVCRYTYNPFGELHTTETEENILNPFKYTGQYFDSETGLYYFRARMYDPQIGRFTAYDPINGKFTEPLSLHKYLYCTNDPINWIDPQGLWEIDVHRQFGDHGWWLDENGNHSLFDYGWLDIFKPPVQYKFPFLTEYTWLHFRSRRDVYDELMIAASKSDVQAFQELMHQWQDSYVHWDRGYRWPLGHVWDPSVDDPDDQINRENRAYERCDYTTTELEKVWFKYNIQDFINDPTAELPEANPWYAIWPDSPLIGY